MFQHLKIPFPNLHDVNKKKTSEQDSCYNCIAWAFNDNTRIWWPDEDVYWPIEGFEGKTALEAFENWFELDDWHETKNTTHENRVLKVALFTLNDEPTHAARLLENGLWTSKLGQYIDISHDIYDLNGPKYGAVYKIYAKKEST